MALLVCVVRGGGGGGLGKGNGEKGISFSPFLATTLLQHLSFMRVVKALSGAFTLLYIKCLGYPRTFGATLPKYFGETGAERIK